MLPPPTPAPPPSTPPGDGSPESLLGPAAAERIAALRPLLLQLNGIKRIRTAATGRRSVADVVFVHAWKRLIADSDAREVAFRCVGEMVTATGLAGLDVGCLRKLGISIDRTSELVSDAIREAAEGRVDPEQLDELVRNARDIIGNCESLEHLRRLIQRLPLFVDQLLRQPRAGATHPTQPRLYLEPAESHGDHCMLVATYATLLAPAFDADPGVAFLVGLAHHLFNAALPDVGFAGDRLLHRHQLDRELVGRSFDLALDQLPRELRQMTENALRHTRRTDTPEARAFHAADVIDRVLEMRWHAESAEFRLDEALHRMNIVHEAPEQQLQRRVLEAADIWSDWSGSRTGSET